MADRLMYVRTTTVGRFDLRRGRFVSHRAPHVLYGTYRLISRRRTIPRFEIGSWRLYFSRNIIIIKGRIDERGSPWAHHNFFCRSPIWMLFRLYIIYFHHEKWLYQVSAPEIKYSKTSWSTILQHTVGISMCMYIPTVICNENVPMYRRYVLYVVDM